MYMINLPGIGGSGEQHWQTRWERAGLPITRFQPPDWDRPQLDEWLQALESAVAASPEPPILVAHSLSCLLVAHWAARSRLRVRGAFLVAVPDPAGPAFPPEAASFAAPPDSPLPFPALIVASADDPYGSPAYARQRAAAWGTGLLDIGAKGHINAASGLGDWEAGQALVLAGNYKDCAVGQ
jgi:predicted alpha/beta hydrolase family esterase